jgi:hypothetical protein
MSKSEVQGQGAATWQDAAWAALEVIAASVDAATGTQFHANQIRQGGEAVLKGGQQLDKKSSIKPNPRFAAAGLGNAPSPVTAAYLKSRAWKSIGGTVVSAAGGAATAVTVVNAPGIARHGSSLGSTGAHLANIGSIAKASMNPVVSDWCKVIMAMKSAKLGTRALETASSAIPGSMVPVAGPVLKIVSTIMKLPIKHKTAAMCYAAAVEIHWSAYREQYGGGSGSFLQVGGKKLDTAAGTASKIFQELFTRRGITAVFGAYDVSAIVGEPGGWLALGDKIALM